MVNTDAWLIVYNTSFSISHAISLKMDNKCKHRRLRKNYPFGRKSKPRITCKICHRLIKPREIQQIKNMEKYKR